MAHPSASRSLQEVEGKPLDLQNDIEYLTEWPPVDGGSEAEKVASRKRPKIDREERASEGRQRRDNCCAAEPAEAGSERVLWARPALARWWRKNQQQRDLSNSTSLPTSDNPNTLLRYVTSLPEGKAFLKQQAYALKSKIALYPESAALHAALASYQDILQDTSSALNSLNIATKLDPHDKNIAWLHLKVQRGKDLEDKRTCFQENLLQNPPLEYKMPSPVEVERHHHNTLGAKDFLLEYSMAGTPVIITGVVETMTTVPWNFQHIKEVVGDKKAPLKRTVKESTEWAKLEPACSMKVADFIDSLGSLEEPLYLFDWSIPTHAPELAKELVMPKYFAGDFLQRTAPGSLYKDSWPSLFIAPEGLHSELHVDAFGSNFWMALFQGRKRWTFFNKDDTPLLYPHFEDSMDLVFDVDLSCPDLHKYPLLSRTTPLQCILQPGELLFVPHGCPHRVENLEDSLAVSANFVDLSNFQVVLAELKANALLDPRAEDLLTQMTRDTFPIKMSSQQNDLPWDEFKMWPRLSYKEYDINITDVN